MRNSRVYDLPTRLFHWVFAGLFIGAFLVAKSIDDESPLYDYHMLMGIILAKLVILRIIWGIFGTQYAKFSSFHLHPRELMAYFKALISGTGRRYSGHNPASSWAAMIMMICGLGLALSGVLMTKEINKEFFEEVHELFAHTFLFVSIGHVAGVILHSLRHKDGIALSMLDGKKEAIQGEPPIQNNRPLAAVLLVTVLGFIAFNLYRNYDAAKGTLTTPVTTLQLREIEDGH